MSGEDFAYFRWHTYWFSEPEGGESCEGYNAWKCYRDWKRRAFT